ncbi:MAG: hypothetical protein IH624_16410 [Phycisphaerae bacterium]|nr:hypothetical protein [Phycisphaerae bacterium]
MSQEGAEIARLASKIYNAFSGIEYPGDDEIAPADGLEEKEVADALRSKDWRELDSKFLNNYCIASITFLHFRAYRFFLPAFLLATVKDYGKVPEIVQDTVFSLLDPVSYQKLYYPELYKEKEAVDWYTFLCRMKPLTYHQVDAIVGVLEFLRNYHTEDFPHKEPQVALEGYWLERLKLERGEEEQES